MTDAFNPYRAWLGVVSDSQPPTHYELLGLHSARSDSQMIAEAFRRQMGRLNPHLSGEHGAIAQRISGELSAARVVLMTPTTKRTYDAELVARSQAAPLSGGSADALLPPSAGPVAPNPTATLVTPPTIGAPANQPPPPSVAPAYPNMAVYPSMAVAGGYAPTPVYGQPHGPSYAGAAPQPVPVGYQPAAGFQGGPAAYPAQPYPGQPPYSGQYPYPAAAMPVSGAYPAATPGTSQPEIVGPAVSTGLSSSSAARVSSKRRSSGGAMLAGILVAGILVAGGVVYFVNAESALLMAERGDGSAAPPVQTDDTSTSLPKAVERTPASVPALQTDRPASRKRAGPKPTSGKPTEKLFTDDPEPPAIPDAMPEKMVDADGSKPSNPDRTKSAAANSEPNKSTPAPNVTPEPPAASPEETAAVRKLLAAARTSLAARDFPGAEDQLAQATLEATSPILLDEVARLEFLATYYNDFWDAVRQHLDQLNAAETINVNGEELSIVEASPEKLIFRAAGKRYEYEFGKLPGKLAFWLAKSWLDEGEPPSLIVLGAYHALDAKGDRQQARELFEQAGAQGLDVRLLLAELDANMNDK